MKIVIDAHIPFIRGVLEPFGEVRYLDGRDITRDAVRQADALIVRTRTTCNRELLEGTAVRFIASATIGFDHIDTDYCAAQNITWTNAAGCNSSSVRQYIAAALVTLARQRRLRLPELTIGIVGVGHVGTKVAQLCTALGMRVLLNDPPRERREGAGTFVPLSRIISESDIISLHVPLNREGVDRTYHLVDASFLSSLRPAQILCNSSRGEVIDTTLMRDALLRQHLGAAVLDVWEHEPDIDRDLLAAVALGTPHIAGYSSDGKANGTAMSVSAVSRFFGLGIDAWYPGAIPLPEKTTLTIDCAGRDVQDVVTEAILATYNIQEDCSRLRSSPETFERQRSAYPLRREFPVYTVDLRNSTNEVISALSNIGFATTGR